MALSSCKECGNEVSTEASACPKCGAKVPRTKWWLWVPLGLVVVLFVFGAITGPKDTTELAKMETESCMRRNGDGEWRASLGVSLETFCKTKGSLIGIKKACEINPSKC
jgi:RNA polymerase subunit RPABC4/transcription elongation factor Spt4